MRGRANGKLGECEEVVEVGADVCITIPVGTEFQFRSSGDEPLSAIGVTLPPASRGEATVVERNWDPTAEPGPI
jgi:mannose-6-phosphate isomerase-like protein (cupin superfamily)